MYVFMRSYERMYVYVFMMYIIMYLRKYIWICRYARM